MNTRIFLRSVCLTALFIFFLISSVLTAQNVTTSSDLNQAGALQLAKNARLEATKMDKDISVAVLNNSGVVLLLLKGDNVGPHNTEASRRKAYTALSTKTSTSMLMNTAAESKDAKNLNTLPELLLLSGGVPIFLDGNLVGGLGISGGGGGENDHHIAVQAVEQSGFTIQK